MIWTVHVSHSWCEATAPIQLTFPNPIQENFPNTLLDIPPQRISPYYILPKYQLSIITHGSLVKSYQLLYTVTPKGILYRFVNFPEI